jgi:hypothetical protein
MTIDWGIVANIGGPILALFVGVWINRKFENRPNLISYYGHISSIRAQPPNQNPVVVHTHAVVLRNAGRKSATNVRLHHQQLPDFTIWPSTPYTVENLPDGTADIVIPNMVPGKELTVSYLYFPPLVATGINAGIESNEGIAKQIPVLLQRIYPQWFNLLALLLMLVGAIAIGYLAIQYLR